MKDKPKFGAFPTDYAQWQVGKTAASIRFVRDASIAMENINVSSLDKGILEEGIRMIKEGEISFSKWVTPEEWIAQVKTAK